VLQANFGIKGWGLSNLNLRFLFSFRKEKDLKFRKLIGLALIQTCYVILFIFIYFKNFKFTIYFLFFIFQIFIHPKDFDVIIFHLSW
jgi:hypothetical protein